MVQRRGLMTHPKKEADMNRDTLKGQWMQLKGKARQQWGKLTDDDLDKIQGNAEMLAGKIQEYYGKTREQAEKELDRWCEQQQGDGQQRSGECKTT
jgi:uncharacterized protein YjbJ (UPF0337 family)